MMLMLNRYHRYLLVRYTLLVYRRMKHNLRYKLLKNLVGWLSYRRFLQNLLLGYNQYHYNYKIDIVLYMRIKRLWNLYQLFQYIHSLYIQKMYKLNYNRLNH